MGHHGGRRHAGQGIKNGRLKPRVSRVLPLAAAAEAHRLPGDRQTIGKVLLSTAG
ncbi:zinc-binding dehydrogenase [Streptomyces sp. NPDC056948]|uniref:zinc-binding dehydrogenase n=1 Tax=Streptomyces sp. NPDC056948 TaxID=3345975 RepID=UPI00362A2719